MRQGLQDGDVPLQRNEEQRRTHDGAIVRKHSLSPETHFWVGHTVRAALQVFAETPGYEKGVGQPATEYTVGIKTDVLVCTDTQKTIASKGVETLKNEQKRTLRKGWYFGFRICLDMIMILFA